MAVAVDLMAAVAASMVVVAGFTEAEEDFTEVVEGFTVAVADFTEVVEDSTAAPA